MKAWLLLTLITMTIGGGFTGVALTSQMLLSQKTGDVNAILILCGFALLNLFVLATGLLFVQNPKRTTPIAIALALQIPAISTPIIGYRYITGLGATVGVGKDGLFYLVRLGSDIQFNLLRPAPAAVGVNLIALVLLIAMTLSTSRSGRSQ